MRRHLRILVATFILLGFAAHAAHASELKFTEALHKQYMENEAYAQADALLNTAWKLLKPNLGEAQYKQILQEQRQWLAKGRDEAASRYSASMPPAEAFAKAMQERSEALFALVAAPPQPGKYDAKYAAFKASVQGDMLHIVGDAYNERGNLCEFEGKGPVKAGWIRIQGATSDFYVRFTKRGAAITYTEDQGCGAGVGFGYVYVKK